MRTSPERLRRRFALKLQDVGSDIVLHWQDQVGGTLDPVTGARLDATVTARTATVRGIVHQAPATSSVRQHAEIEVGDLIVDFAWDVALDGKPALVFEVDGRKYRQKELSGVLTRSWDVLLAGARVTRTVLLTLAS